MCMLPDVLLPKILIHKTINPPLSGWVSFYLLLAAPLELLLEEELVGGALL